MMRECNVAAAALENGAKKIRQADRAEKRAGRCARACARVRIERLIAPARARLYVCMRRVKVTENCVCVCMYVYVRSIYHGERFIALLSKYQQLVLLGKARFRF